MRQCANSPYKPNEVLDLFNKTSIINLILFNFHFLFNWFLPRLEIIQFFLNGFESKADFNVVVTSRNAHEEPFKGLLQYNILSCA